MKNSIYLLIIFALFSCNKLKNKTKEKINQSEEIVTRSASESGEAIGETTSNFIDGIGSGIDKSKEITVSTSKSLIEKGVKSGNFSVENDSLGNENNLLILYLIFEKDFNDKIQVKIIDKNNTEIGRISKNIEGKKGNAGYYEFLFDKRTQINKKSKIIIE